MEKLTCAMEMMNLEHLKYKIYMEVKDTSSTPGMKNNDPFNYQVIVTSCPEWRKVTRRRVPVGP